MASFTFIRGHHETHNLLGLEAARKAHAKVIPWRVVTQSGIYWNWSDTNMIKPNQSSHWYDKDGQPAYDATLREAKKYGLYPSVTSIIGILEKPPITSWAVNLMSEVCWNNASEDCEALSDYRERIEPIYQEKRKKAAEVGSAIHDYIQEYMEGANGRPSGKRVQGYEKQCELIEMWLDDNVEWAECEKSFSWFVNDLGYGGKIDIYGRLNDGRLFIADFKTQDLKGKDKPNWYDEWKWQLSAYRSYLNATSINETSVALSVVIDTGDIKQIHSREYSDEEMGKAWNKFAALTKAFYAIKELG
jgi:hypothetical protein